MMSDDNDNPRRSSRRKQPINYNENPVKTQSPKTPAGVRKSSRTSTNVKDAVLSTPKTGRKLAETSSSVKNRLGRKAEGSLSMREFDKALNEICEDVQKPLKAVSDDESMEQSIDNVGIQSIDNSSIKKTSLSRTSAPSRTPRSLKIVREPRVLINRVNTPPKKSPRASARSQKIPQRKFHYSGESESESVSEDEEYQPSGSESASESEHTPQEDLSEDEINEKAAKVAEIKRTQVPITPCRRGRSRNLVTYKDYDLKTDEYFENALEKGHTSNHTLSRLKNPRLDGEKLQELLKSQTHVSTVHKNGIYALTESHKANFMMWYHIMEEGYSLLLHGLGSKRALMNDFRRGIVSDHPTLFVNGFFPGLTIKDVFEGIIGDLMNRDCPSNPSECFKIIEDVMTENPHDRLYLIVHNIDGPALRSEKAQDFLSRLAAIPNVRLLASVDHINAPLMWGITKRSRYNFYFWDATTLLPYEAETSYESSLLVQRSGALVLSSLQNVFASSTTKSKELFKILMKYQLQNGKNNLYSGMAFKDLYRCAREAFLGSTDAVVRAQLTEFIDHKLLKTKRNIDGTEYVTIPVDNSLLQRFLDDLES